eukprot:gene8923-18462_t
MQGVGPSVPLGDFLQRIAMKTYEELLANLDAMLTQSPELRAEKLKLFVSRIKKRMAVAYAICSWLKEPHIKKYLESTSLLLEDVNAQQSRLNQIQDTLFYAHMGLYGKRTRPLDVVIAKDILARGTYAHLPTSIFTCGLDLTPKELNIEQLQNDLNMFIKAKLILTVKISLEFASEESQWTIHEIKILIDSHNDEMLDTGYDPIPLENILSTAIRLLYIQALESSRSIWQGFSEVLFLETMEDFSFIFRFWKNSVSNKYKFELKVRLFRPISDFLRIQLYHIDNNSKNSNSNTSHSTEIESYATSTSSVNENTREIYWNGSYTSDDNDMNNDSTNHTTEDDDNDDNKDNSNKVSSTDGEQFDSQHNKNKKQKKKISEDYFRELEKGVCDDCISHGGVRFSKLLEYSLEACTRLRLHVLVCRLQNSMELQHAISTGGFQLILPNENTCTVSIILNGASGNGSSDGNGTSVRVRVRIAVDTRTGSFVLFTEGMGTTGGIATHTVCDKLLSEINSIDFEINFSLQPSMDNTTASKPNEYKTTIVNLLPVLQHMALAWWAHQLSIHCNITPLPGWSPAVIASAHLEGPGLIFNVLSWQEMRIIENNDEMYDIATFLCVTINETLQVQCHVFLTSTALQMSALSPPEVWTVRCLGPPIATGATLQLSSNDSNSPNINTDIAQLLGMYLEEALVFTVKCRVPLAASHICHVSLEPQQKHEQHQQQQGKGGEGYVIPIPTGSLFVSGEVRSSGVWNILTINNNNHHQLLSSPDSSNNLITSSPTSTSSSSSTSQQYILIRSTLTEVSLVLVHNRRDLNISPRMMMTTSASVSEKDYQAMPLPSENALQLPWVDDSTLVIERVDDKVAVVLSGNRDGVVGVSDGIRILSHVSRLWPRLRDMMRQLKARRETLWMSPLGPNRVLTHGLHVTVTFYLSKITKDMTMTMTKPSQSSSPSPSFVTTPNDPLLPLSEEHEHDMHHMEGVECMGQAIFSLGCLRTRSDAIAKQQSVELEQIIRQQNTSNKTSAASAAVASETTTTILPMNSVTLMSDNDPLATQACLNFRITNIKNISTVPWALSAQGVYYSSYVEGLLNICLEFGYKRNEHARQSLNNAIATARPLIEFFWLLSNQCMKINSQNHMSNIITTNTASPSNMDMDNSVNAKSLDYSILFKCQNIWTPSTSTFTCIHQYTNGNTSNSEPVLFDVQSSYLYTSK